MRVFLVSRSRQLRLLMDAVAQLFDLTVEAVTLQMALNAREGTPVLLHTERWDDGASATVYDLTAVRAQVYVICPDAADYRTRLAMLVSGARDAAIDHSLALAVLAFKVRRDVGVRGSLRWRLGAYVFVPEKSCLYRGGNRIDLTPTEVRLLQRLCQCAERNRVRRKVVHSEWALILGDDR